MQTGASVKSDAPNTGKRTCTYVMVGPSLGLTNTQIAALKKKFKNEIVATLGGADAMSRGEIVLKIIVQTTDLNL